METKFNFSDVNNNPRQIGMTALAKKLGIGRSKMYQFLREMGVLDQNNLPAEGYINDYFNIETKMWVYGNGASIILLATPEGSRLIERLVREKYVDKKLVRKTRNIWRSSNEAI